MDFDLSKENIQPLRGGRNAQQLGMALQAQTNQEYQMQLLQQKDEFETAIRNYQGDDPLENYYSYISWVEQSYPKHGHEGNLIPLLEHCLGLFENDRRYTNDRRFCKLWIKYFDQLPNPLEFYHMLNAKGLCKGCADFYKAWAYYYEAVGDFQNANSVFEEGKQNLAQPYEELEIAHKNLITAAGEHILYGPNENRLMEKRQALTSLHTYEPGRVGSVRVPAGNGMAVFPSQGHTLQTVAQQRNVAPIPVFEDRSGTVSGGVAGAEAAPPLSIIQVAKRQEAPKENTLKPGPWATVPVKKRVIAHKSNPGFTVHEDSCDGIRLPPNYSKECYEDYSDWCVSIKYPEEQISPNMIPMYPKAKVYVDPTTEFSLEELRAARYRQNVETCQEVQPILVDDDEDDNCIEITEDNVATMPHAHNKSLRSPVSHPSFKPNISVPKILDTDSPQLFTYLQPQPNNTTAFNHTHQTPPRLHRTLANDSTFIPGEHNVQTSMRLQPGQMVSPEKPKFSILVDDDEDEADEAVGMWTPQQMKKPPAVTPFMVYEEPAAFVPQSVQPKGSNMKTAFKTLTADDFVETGSRGGRDVAAVAQPSDGARRMPFISDSSSSSFEDNNTNTDPIQELNSSCTTQQFNFNLKAMHVSTPQNKRQILGSASEDVQATRKQLFLDNKNQEKDKVLSTIVEESKSGFGSSSSSSNATTKSSIFSNHTNRVTTSEEHNSYLAQNLMANAALRASLLGEIMDDFKPEPSMVETEPQLMQSSPVISSPVRRMPVAAANVKPLDTFPSDPFKPQVIQRLLEHVNFPGPHERGLVTVPVIPRLVVMKNKEPICIGNERYIIEKQLGKGTFGTVYKAIELGTKQMVALKHQKPSNKWEFYICREMQARLVDHPLRDRFMDVYTGYFCNQASVLVSEFMPFGSLLDAANTVKTKLDGKMKELLCIYFTLEMMKIVKAMHDVKIIHADIKPDNFLVFQAPDNTLRLQLIDFGCSIDMTLYPPNAAFTRMVTTEDFICCEMKDNRPWNYHTDLYCIAASAHVLVFDKYIQLRKTEEGLWCVTNRMTRYMRVDLWNMFFSNLLNQQTGPADLDKLIVLFEEQLDGLKDLPAALRSITNLLKNR